MIEIAYPNPKRRSLTLRDSFCWTHVGNVSTARRYSWFYANCGGHVTTRHAGIDVHGEKGDRLVAEYDGIVRWISDGVALGLHQFVIVDAKKREWGYYHTYDRPKNGLRVERGQFVAHLGNESYYVGRDGRLHPYNIGAHLHDMLFTSSNHRHSAVNPYSYLYHAKTHGL